MNDPKFFIIVAWRTGNARRQARIESATKDYGLSRLQPSLYVGRLSKRERRELLGVLHQLLIGKRDQLHVLGSCRSCSLHSNIPEVIERHYNSPSFEII